MTILLKKLTLRSHNTTEEDTIITPRIDVNTTPEVDVKLISQISLNISNIGIKSHETKVKNNKKKITLCDKCNEPTGTIHYRCDSCDIDLGGGWHS